MELPNLVTLQQESQRLGLSTSATEIHGSLTGWLAGGGAAEMNWLACIFADTKVPVPEQHSGLAQLYTVTSLQLTDPNIGFELLLAADSAPLTERIDTLFAWCRSFLGGFGLAWSSCSRLSAMGREALNDLAELARVSSENLLSHAEDEDRWALEEIEQYVKVAVFLLRDDCLGPTSGRRQ